MTIGALVLNIGIVAIIITAIIGYWKRGHVSWIMTFLQNFTGVLFIFSGWVKAVDPLGTAYKMEQYFAEFQATFEGTWFAFISPVFPFFAEYAIAFSLFMIIFEIVLGIMLLLGDRPKLTAWAFFLLVVFFTILTGFTFLTGYVPQGANFFEFGKWVSYDANNMKVTDCGCFGDFIKLEPKISFFKDIVLLVPAFYFVFRHKDMHQLFTPRIRNVIVAISTIGLILYCLNNYMWNLPHTDFRPFKKGANIAQQYEAEQDAMANVQITGWKLQNIESNKVVELSNEVYMKEFKNYPKSEWKVIDQIKTKPTVEKTKISDFEIENIEGYSARGDYLEEKGYRIMLVAQKLKGEGEIKQVTLKDTTYTLDTSYMDGLTMPFVKKTPEVKEITKQITVYDWDNGYLESYKDEVVPFVTEAAALNIPAGLVAGQSTPEMIKQLAKDAAMDIDLYTADDILLKTIIRSNPGVVLWKDGTIIDKWHINKLPKWSEVKAKYEIKKNE